MRKFVFLTIFFVPALLHASTFNDQGTVPRDTWIHFGPFHAQNGDFVAQLTAVGDADLYLREGSEPTRTSYDCRPYSGTNVSETCSASGPGTFYISIRGYSYSSEYELTVTYEETVQDDDTCRVDADCTEAGSFCQTPAGQCGGAGVCSPNVWAMMCTQQYDPVCSCTGETFSNACMAMLGMGNVAYKGICRGDEGGMCGGIAGFPCNEGLYCKGMDPMISDPAGECRPKNYCFGPETAAADCAPWQEVIRPTGPGAPTCDNNTCMWALDVSIVELLAHPMDYNGKHIKVVWEVGEVICQACTPQTQYKMILEDTSFSAGGEVTLRQVTAPEPQRYAVTGLFTVETSALGSKNYLEVIHMVDAPACEMAPGCPDGTITNVDENGCYLYDCPDLSCSYADQACPDGYECIWGCPTAAPCGINPPGKCRPLKTLVTEKETGTVYRNEWDHYSYVAEAGEFVATLTLNADADLYVQLGAAPNAQSYDCRPYNGNSDEEQCRFLLTEITEVFVAVNGWDNRTDYTLNVEYTAADKANR